jgi:hypothetical protein
VKHGSNTSLFRLFPTIQLGGVPERTAVLAFSLFRVQGPFLQNYNSVSSSLVIIAGPDDKIDGQERVSESVES